MNALQTGATMPGAFTTPGDQIACGSSTLPETSTEPPLQAMACRNEPL